MIAKTNSFDIPLTIGEAVRMVARGLRCARADNPRLDARLLVALAAGVSPETYLIYPEMALDEATRDRIASLMMRRMLREPMSHILGEKEFWSMGFDVTADTLTPRPDTECLVEATLAEVRKRKSGGNVSILDLGTGTGCILLALLSELPAATGVGVDVSADTLNVARRNAARHGLDSRAMFLASDWFSAVQGQYDVIVSNPPYIITDEISGLDPEVARHEPMMALDGGRDGLSCYREICPKASSFLKPGGLLAVEVGMGQSDAVGVIFEGAGFSDVRTHQDLAGQHRVVMATPLKL